MSSKENNINKVGKDNIIDYVPKKDNSGKNLKDESGKQSNSGPEYVPLIQSDYESQVGEVRDDMPIIKGRLLDGSVVRIYSVYGKPANMTGGVRDREDFDRIRERRNHQPANNPKSKK